MGLQAQIEKMPEKLKQLYLNILSIILVVTIVYGAITFMQEVLNTGNFIGWFSGPAFLNTVVIVVVVMVVSKILKGGKIQVPQNPSGKKTEINIPDTWGVKKYGKPISLSKSKEKQKKPKLHNKPVIKPKYIGTWNCSCGHLAMGEICEKCGKKR